MIKAEILEELKSRGRRKINFKNYKVLCEKLDLTPYSKNSKEKENQLRILEERYNIKKMMIVVSHIIMKILLTRRNENIKNRLNKIR